MTSQIPKHIIPVLFSYYSAVHRKLDFQSLFESDINRIIYLNEIITETFIEHLM